MTQDRAALAKLALALSASQQLGREELADKLQWLKASVKAGFSDLLERWSTSAARTDSVQPSGPPADAAVDSVEPSMPPAAASGDAVWPSEPAGATDETVWPSMPADAALDSVWPSVAPVGATVDSVLPSTPPAGATEKSVGPSMAFGGATVEEPGKAQELPHISPQEAVWGPTTFEFTKSLGKVDSTVAYCPGAFLAMGEVLCLDRYIMMQVHVVNRAFQRAPLAMESEFDFPHMTLAKLESGESEHIGDETIWKSAVKSKEINITRMLTQLNHNIKCSGLPFRLIPVHVRQCWYGERYNITGGEGLKVFRHLQALVLAACVKLGPGSVQEWSQEPGHPHITYEYPSMREAQRWGCDDCGSIQGSCRSSSTSRASSLERILQRLEEARLRKYRKLFMKERLGVTALLDMDDARLKEAGVSAMGDRIKILKIRESLLAEP